MTFPKQYHISSGYLIRIRVIMVTLYTRSTTVEKKNKNNDCENAQKTHVPSLTKMTTTLPWNI